MAKSKKKTSNPELHKVSNTKLKFKNVIATKLTKLLRVHKQDLLELIQIPKSHEHGQFTLPIPRLLKLTNDQDQDRVCKDIIFSFGQDTHIKQVTAQGHFLNFSVNQTEYIKETLQNVYEERERYGQTERADKTVLIDFSSPNIAKPFHAGHLRSTILGAFIKRIYEANGYTCIGLNYLGDWGKQYGLLAVGYKKYGNPEELKKDPIKHLYDIYVKINQEMKEESEKIEQEAAAYFKKMEDKDPEVIQQWKEFRDQSIQSYEKAYKRLGIKFDHFSGESETEKYIPQVYEALKQKGLCDESEDGSMVINLSMYDPSLGKAVIRKANGASLYLTRDIASVIMRCEKFKGLDKIIYVVGIEQEHHFKQLFKIIELLWDKHDHCPELIHVPFGRITGMSTRKGTSVFLSDILDTSKESMLKTIKEDMRHGKYMDILNEGISVGNHIIKGEEAVGYIADTLGISDVITQDMAAKRMRNYNFVWDRMMDAKGDTGVFLQYTYARICGIERKMDINISIDCDFSLLAETEAFELTRTISLYPDKVRAAFKTLEPCTIVLYLFKLAHMISQVNYNLRIKDVDPKLAQARLLLFWAAKTTLANGMRLVGLKPLERM
ncbi:Arginyl-tRNA synthetase [Rhizopus azygosporus]|uniref:arginine--tRNA ligase n=1 Tax=Rhizopus azygosporus TaxID=86630 RepID=A0A367JMK5_RHIAZ|nr:Arginyl-tRNA synthetase [Rhizopus azygosporus]